MAKDTETLTYTLKQAVAARVEDHVEIAVEAQDGTKFKIVAAPDQVDALVGDLETSLEGSDTVAAG